MGPDGGRVQELGDGDRSASKLGLEIYNQPYSKARSAISDHPLRRATAQRFGPRCRAVQQRRVLQAIHETLEILWQGEADDVRYLYQGILLVGVGLYHFERHNPRGAAIKLGAAIDYLHRVRPGLSGNRRRRTRSPGHGFLSDKNVDRVTSSALNRRGV